MPFPALLPQMLDELRRHGRNVVVHGDSLEICVKTKGRGFGIRWEASVAGLEIRTDGRTCASLKCNNVTKNNKSVDSCWRRRLAFRAG